MTTPGVEFAPDDLVTAIPAATPPSGFQCRISYGDQQATITEVGAAVREYRVGDRDVFQPYGEHDFSQAFHGAVLMPWPNRIRDGRYRFDGVDYQLALTEPTRSTALHGLSPWRPWSVVSHETSRVVLSLSLLPHVGYPFQLDTEVEYALGAEGLAVTTRSTNVGGVPLPYGIGFHPYLSAGGALLDDCELRIDAGRRFLCDDRLIPVGSEDVEGTPYDFRAPRRLDSLIMDDAFSGVPRDADGKAWISLSAPDGYTASVWSDESCPFWQVFTGDTLPGRMRRAGMAAEPMTAAPDAFNSGTGLIVLAPGESSVARWGAVLRTS